MTNFLCLAVIALILCWSMGLFASVGKPKQQESQQEGTADKDGNGKPNIPGPNELPDQQKVGEDNDDDEKYHVET